MSNRADEIRKRIAKRKKLREKTVEAYPYLQQDEERYGYSSFSSYETGPDQDAHPLFSKEAFIFKVLVSAVLVLVIAIVFRQNSETSTSIQQFVKTNMEKEFQFAAVTDWYEEKFGKPLTLFATKQTEDTNETQKASAPKYAIPASGKVLIPFSKDGQGVMVETVSNSSVEAMTEGVVTFVGEKDKLGKTVIIQHADGSETWYANLGSIMIPQYEFVEMGKEIGQVKQSDDGTKGSFYFAIKKGDTFIDPIQVIPFE